MKTTRTSIPIRPTNTKRHYVSALLILGLATACLANGASLARNPDFDSLGTSEWQGIDNNLPAPSLIAAVTNQHFLDFNNNVVPPIPTKADGLVLQVHSPAGQTPWVSGAQCELTENVLAHSRIFVSLDAYSASDELKSLGIVRKYLGSSQERALLPPKFPIAINMVLDVYENTPHFMFNLVHPNNKTDGGSFHIDNVEISAKRTRARNPHFSVDLDHTTPHTAGTPLPSMLKRSGPFTNGHPSEVLQVSIPASPNLPVNSNINNTGAGLGWNNEGLTTAPTLIVGFQARWINGNTRLNVQQKNSTAGQKRLHLSSNWTHHRFEIETGNLTDDILLNLVDANGDLASGVFQIDNIIITTK